MKSMKVWIAVAMAVLAVGAGAFIATSSGGGDGKRSTAPTSVPAETTALTPDAGVAGQMVGNVLSQITQAANSGGQPRAITPEEAEALLRQQLQQLGVPTS